jgi:prepilin-type N-terminal cleavage/methylation domain-containing protein
MNRRTSPGFTLLEVLIAMVILSVAVVGLIQTASQGLRLLKVSSDHQEAVALGDRLVRAVDSPVEGADAGQEGQFSWERRVRVVAVPDELSPTSGSSPQLLALSVAVRWSNGRTVEVATLRTVQGTAATP